MRIIVTSDFHLDSSTAGMRRFEDLCDSVDQTVQCAIKEKVDYYLFTGDLMDPDSGSCVFRCIKKAIQVARHLDSYGIKSIWLAGNHDVIEDGSGETTLSPLEVLGPNVFVPTLPCHHYLGKTRWGAPVNLLCLPFTATARSYEPKKVVQEYWETSEPEAYTVVAGHLNISGIIPGEETNEMPRGRDIYFPLSEFERKDREYFLINGHYHKAQTFNGIHIPGALQRLTFGEEQHDPGFLLLEI